MGRYRKREMIHYGVDYFKAYIRFSDDSIFSGMSDNSNLAFLDDETRIDLMQENDKFFRLFRLSDMATNIPIAFVGMGALMDSKEFFEVTGQGLILRNGPGFFLDAADKMGVEIVDFKRIDICLDMAGITPQYVDDYLLSDKQKKRKGKVYYDKKQGKIETIYFGEKSAKKNQYQLLRVYDKVADTIAKKKGFLYDFENDDKITRFELEIRRDLARFWTPEKLIDTNYIFAVIVKNIYRLNNQFFGFVEFEDFIRVAKSKNSLHKERKKKIEDRYAHQITYGSSFRDDDERLRWIQLFRTYGLRLMGDGMSPHELVKILET